MKWYLHVSDCVTHCWKGWDTRLCSACDFRVPLRLSVGCVRRGRSWGTGLGRRKESGSPLSCGTRWRVRRSYNQPRLKWINVRRVGSQAAVSRNEEEPLGVENQEVPSPESRTPRGFSQQSTQLT